MLYHLRCRCSCNVRRSQVLSLQLVSPCSTGVMLLLWGTRTEGWPLWWVRTPVYKSLLLECSLASWELLRNYLEVYLPGFWELRWWHACGSASSLKSSDSCVIDLSNATQVALSTQGEVWMLKDKMYRLYCRTEVGNIPYLKGWNVQECRTICTFYLCKFNYINLAQITNLHTFNRNLHCSREVNSGSYDL